MSDVPDGTAAGKVQRYTRRLSDKILIAFHSACDQADCEVAEQLLHVLEMMLTRRPLAQDGTRRRNMESLVAAHERLWQLRHPDSRDDHRERSTSGAGDEYGHASLPARP